MGQIAVIGVGNFGYWVAAKLSQMGSEVLAIDNDEDKLDRVKSLVARAVIGDATNKDLLSELGLRNLDAVVLSLGSRLEASIISALYLKELGVETVIVKAVSEEHIKVLNLIGVKRVIFPEKDMGMRLAASLHGANFLDYLPIGPDLSIMEMPPLPEMAGKTPAELDFRREYKCQILALKEGGSNGRAFIPEPDTVIKKDHLVVLMGRDKDLARLKA